MIPGVRLSGRRQHSQFWSILTRFVDYYSLFWGPECFPRLTNPGCVYVSVINTRGFVDSDPFRGLLLTVLGSQSNFNCCRTPRCAYVLVVKNRSLGRFWPVSWTITQFWVPNVITTIDELRGAFTCRSSTLAVFIDSDPFRGLLLTILGVLK